MHTPLCRHAAGEPTELAARAVAIGLREIGFSDHSPMPRDDFDDWRMRAVQLDDYVAGVAQARRDHPSLTIKLALEVDYLPGHEDWIRELAAKQPWDYLIGSVHYIGGGRTLARSNVAATDRHEPGCVPTGARGDVSDRWAIDNPQLISEWKRRDPWEVWTAYFERLTLAAESGLFDIIGHADLCKKFCFYPEQDCTPLFVRFLDAAKRRGTAIELNTAGLRKDCREIYPSLSFLRLAAERGVPITFGSDAHAPTEVGLDFARALEMARAAGYAHWSRFTRRKREFCQL